MINAYLRVLAAIVLALPPVAATTCEQLKDPAITRVATVAAAKDVPAYCQVQATLRPSADSDIKMEVWLPLSGWNGKYQAVGNGGWSGSISRPAMAQALRRGYATSSTDTGHEGGSASFALGHPEKLIDYAYRSEHEMTVKSKAIVTAFYGAAPKLSYWNGCSAGGKQALMEAQRYPDDYDGIIAGSPALDWIARAALSIWVAQAVHKNEAGYIPREKYQLIHDAALKACHSTDGAIDDPLSCTFDPSIPGLTPEQIEAARKIYAGPGAKVAPGLSPGSELGWATFGGPKPLSIGLDYFKYVVFKDPDWNFQTLNFGSDIARAKESDIINAKSPNLAPFRKHGGKLIQYHGWSDPQIPPMSSVEYYKSVQATMGKNVQDFYRLFMVPGMAHCGATFDALDALEQWVEHKNAPTRMISPTRTTCAFPEITCKQ